MASTGDKAKATASSIFGKTKTFTARATQKVMVKFGKAEETVDIQFNQEAERFVNHSKAVKKNKERYHKTFRNDSRSFYFSIYTC